MKCPKTNNTSYHGPNAFTVMMEEDVLWFNVSMYYPFLVKINQTTSYIRYQLQYCVEVDGLPVVCSPAVKITQFHNLCHQQWVLTTDTDCNWT